MKKIAIMFPGQGSQFIGMLNDFQDNKTIRSTIEEASSVLNYDLWDLISQDLDGKLNVTEYTQPALLAASIAMWRVFCENSNYIQPDFFVGHSLGEYSALVAADSLLFVDALKLVAKRGALMQQACPKGVGSMAAILGLDNDIIAAACNEIAKDNNSIVSCANYNAPGQTVIAGDYSSVEKTANLCKERGAKLVKILDVSVPSHCALMHPMQQDFSNLIDSINFKKPSFAVISNVSAKPYESVQEIRDLLSKQLSYPVRWVESIECISNFGIYNFVECGPGQVLSKLIKRIDKNLDGSAFEQYISR